MSHVYISAAHKSSGKTTITLGLCSALREAGHDVRPFKKGPDYIDPMWLSRASGYPCHNLDFYTQSDNEILQLFTAHHHGGDISIIEGNKGLSDGLDPEGSNSSAALASLVKAPVVLVIDTQGITRSVVPLLLGFKAFEPGVNIAGVILNKVAGNRHEQKLRDVIARYTDIPVVGAVHRHADLEITERHLGLIPSNEASEAEEIISRIASRIKQQVDLDMLVDIAGKAETPSSPSEKILPVSAVYEDMRIGIFQDAAFGFYYPDDLEAFRQYGAEIVPISAIKDSAIPEINGLFIGGGFPETHMFALERNRPFQAMLRNMIEAGLPTYAECGGLMYLCKNIEWNGKSANMSGVLEAKAVMHARPVGRGYVKLENTEAHPWPAGPGAAGSTIAAHEFHYSGLSELPDKYRYAYRVKRGAGLGNGYDGLIYKNLVANYTHQRNVYGNLWISRFLEFVSSTGFGG